MYSCIRKFSEYAYNSCERFEKKKKVKFFKRKINVYRESIKKKKGKFLSKFGGKYKKKKKMEI